MPKGGARTGAGRKRRRFRLSPAAAHALDKELAWATEDVQNEILSNLVLLTPSTVWTVLREMGVVGGVMPGGDDKPIII